MLRVLKIAGVLGVVMVNAQAAQSQTIQARLQKTFAGAEEGRYVAFSPDSKMVAQSNVGPQVRIWSVPDRKLLATFNHPTGVPAVAFSPDGQFVAAGSYDNLIRIWS